MIMRIVGAVVVAVLVGLVCVALLGPLIEHLPGPFAAIVGAFLITYGWVLGILAGLWWWVGNYGWPWTPRPRA